MSESMNELLSQAAEKQLGDVDETQLARLSEAAEQQLEIEQRVEDLEGKLKEAKQDLTQIKTQLIPDLMDEVGIQSFTLSSGDSIEVVPFYSASIPGDRKVEAFDWLRTHEYEDIIKVDVKVPFQKAEYSKAVELAQELNDKGFDAIPNMGVHAMTLKGWVRMMAEEGEEFPLDLFGAFIGRNTKIKRSKK